MGKSGLGLLEGVNKSLLPTSHGSPFTDHDTGLTVGAKNYRVHHGGGVWRLYTKRWPEGPLTATSGSSWIRRQWSDDVSLNDRYRL